LLLWWKDLVFSLREEIHYSGKRQHEQEWGQQCWTMLAVIAIFVLSPSPNQKQNLNQNIHKSIQEAMNPKHHNEQLLPPPLLGFNDDNAMDDTMKIMKNGDN
jgi:hypothetical protein